MLENRDPAIKLFGRTIQLPANEEVPPARIDDGAAADSVVSDDEVNEGHGDDVGPELVKVWKRIVCCWPIFSSFIFLFSGHFSVNFFIIRLIPVIKRSYLSYFRCLQ